MVILGAGGKYEATVQGPPCLELLHLCRARCCMLRFPLATEDLDEGIVRWDGAQPYLIQQRTDGYCVHSDERRCCSVYEQRPRPCREYDCRGDDRIWRDYESRIPAGAPASVVG